MSADFVSGLLAGLACALTGGLIVFVVMALQDRPRPPHPHDPPPPEPTPPGALEAELAFYANLEPVGHLGIVVED